MKKIALNFKVYDKQINEFDVLLKIFEYRSFVFVALSLIRAHWCENSSQRDLKFHKLHFSIHIFLHRSGEFENGIL